jgi:hypothetical protein
MEAQLVVFAVIFISLIPIAWLWVRGIDYMHKNHPDYKGDDLFGIYDEETTHTNGKH